MTSRLHKHLCYDITSTPSTCPMTSRLHKHLSYDITSTQAPVLCLSLSSVVLVSDVVYDPDLLPGLVRLLSMVLRCSSPGGPQVFICSPIRNPDTYNSFKRQLGTALPPSYWSTALRPHLISPVVCLFVCSEEAGICHDIISGAGRQVLSYHRAASIQMIQLTLRTQ